ERYLRHRGEALLLARRCPETVSPWVGFVTKYLPAWYWTQVLDAAAQAAGLCVQANHPETMAGPRVVACYEGLDIRREVFAGEVHLKGRQVRSLMGMHVVEVCGMRVDGPPVVTVKVTLAGEAAS
ncbi:MAG: hypothetical protein ACPG4T_11485, partial [Nannocystaceae bacterium]